MIGGVYSSGGDLQKAYAYSRGALAAAFEQAALGKKYSRPSDDFSVYLRAETQIDAIAHYQRIKENLMTAKAIATRAVTIGESVYESLTELKSLIDEYNSAETDSERVAAAGEFEAAKNALGDWIQNGADVYTTALLSSVPVTPAGQSYVLQFNAVASTGALTTSFGALPDNPAQTATTIGMIQQLSNAAQFLTEANRAVDNIDRHISLTETIMRSKHAVVDQITTLDDAESMAALVSGYIRHEAAVSMLAQANCSTHALSMLYEADAAPDQQHYTHLFDWREPRR